MSFLGDLKEWKDYEEIIRNILNWNFNTNLSKNTNRLGIDLVSDGLCVEVKYDRQCRTTGNIFLEYECLDKPSWVNQYNWANALFIYWDYEEAYVFNLAHLQELIADWVKNKTYRLINWGDGWKSKWVLVPISELKKYIVWTIHFNNFTHNGNNNLHQAEESKESWREHYEDSESI
jgi:hypothetical protein